MAPRKDELRLLLAEMNKALGVEGKVYFGSQQEEFQRIPTGLLAFDTLTGGGLVSEHLVELYGEEGAGKTLLALLVVAACQRKGLRCAWVKGEEFEAPWAIRQGVDMKKLLQVEALSGDKMLEAAATLIESGLVDVMVFDSYQAIGTMREQESGVDSESYASGGAPQLWARMYRRTRGAFNGRKSRTALIGISQVREKIGGFSPNGRPEPVPTQIRVLKHWKAISIQCKKGEPRFEDLKNDKRRVVAREFNLRCVKNKTAGTEQRVASYWYRFEGDHVGVDYAEEAVRLGKVYGLLQQKGAVLEGYGLRVKGSKSLGVKATDAFTDKLREANELLHEVQADIVDMAARGTK